MKGDKTLKKLYAKRIGMGVALSCLVSSFAFFGGGINSFGKVFLYENVPLYEYEFLEENESGVLLSDENKAYYAEPAFNTEMHDNKEVDVINNLEIYETGDVVGKNDISFGPSDSIYKLFSEEQIKKLSDINYLKKSYYIVDKKTGVTSDYFNVNNFLKEDLKIKKNADMPKVLIFHTHSQEMFKDSKSGDISEGIVGAGDRLAELLENKYGIKCIHNRQSFDVVDGKNKIIGAYERMEPVIRKIIADNPSIEVVIDLHRDGIDESRKLVTVVDGKNTAQVMFFNGLCRTYSNGKLSDISGLSNPYIKQNLALSFAMQSDANAKYPLFSRGIYLNAYRYSLHMMPKSLLIEVGAQNNTKQEIYNAIDIIAELLYDVVG